MPFQTTSSPLLPGSAEWRKWRETKDAQKRAIEQTPPKIDTTSAPIRIENEIDRKRILVGNSGKALALWFREAQK